MKTLFLLLLTALIFLSCSEKKVETTTEKKTDSKDPKVRTSVMTEEIRASFTPQQILDSLKKRNERFAQGEMVNIDYNSQILKTAEGQTPKALILSCLDSRVPVETVFNLGIGDIFVGRVAGNIVNPDLLGSMEYGCKVVGAKVLLVLGHTECGAIKAAIDNVKLGNITELLSKIRLAVDSSVVNFQGEKTSKDNAFVKKVTDKNVMLTIENIRKNSPILKEMEEKGELKIAGGVYDLNTGRITFF